MQEQTNTKDQSSQETVYTRNRKITNEEVEKVLEEAKKELRKKPEKISVREDSNVSTKSSNHVDQKIMKKIDNKDMDSSNLHKNDMHLKNNKISEQEKRKDEESNGDHQMMADGFTSIVDPSINEYKKKKTSTGDKVGTICEGIWITFKVSILLLIIIVISGVLISKDLLVRGENGPRKSMEGMQVSTSVLVNKNIENKRVTKWLEEVKREKVYLESDDGNIMVARKIITNQDSNKWVVILHGYNGTMADVNDIAMHYAKEGFNILTPDLRGNGESEGRFLGMGWLDRLDLINWIDIILKENPSANIVVHGVDLGAEAAIMMTGEPLKNNIKVVIAEGAYPNAYDMVKKEYKARDYKLPAFPFLNMTSPVMKVWAGYDLKEANAIKQVKKATVPILLIHGGNNTYVTKNMIQYLDEEIASSHQLHVIPTGTQGDCRYAEPDNYYKKTFEFVNTYIK